VQRQQQFMLLKQTAAGVAVNGECVIRIQTDDALVDVALCVIRINVRVGDCNNILLGTILEI
jgi:hypothetical protein